MDERRIRDVFRYHRPPPEAVLAMERIRALTTETVVEVAAMIPESRERSAYVSLMQQAQMMANAAIAIHGLPEEEP